MLFHYFRNWCFKKFNALEPWGNLLISSQKQEHVRLWLDLLWCFQFHGSRIADFASQPTEKEPRAFKWREWEMSVRKSSAQGSERGFIAKKSDSGVPCGIIEPPMASARVHPTQFPIYLIFQSGAPQHIQFFKFSPRSASALINPCIKAGCCGNITLLHCKGNSQPSAKYFSSFIKYPTEITEKLMMQTLQRNMDVPLWEILY